MPAISTRWLRIFAWCALPLATLAATATVVVGGAPWQPLSSPFFIASDEVAPLARDEGLARSSAFGDVAQRVLAAAPGSGAAPAQEPSESAEVAHRAGEGVEPSDPAFAGEPLRAYVGAAVTLRTDASDAYARGLLVKLDSFVAQANAELTRLLDVSSKPVHPTVVVFETQDRYQRHARRNAPGLVNNGGYYDGSTRTVVTYRYNNSMQLYFHEVVHALMAEHFDDHHFSRYTRKNWPIWFDEGMSEYLGSYAVDGTGIRIPAPNRGKLAYLANALAHRSFVPLEVLLRAPASAYSGASMNIYYAESWGLIDYLARHPIYNSQLPLFFRRIRNNDDGLTAFASSFGDDLADFEKAWRDHIRRAVEPPARGVWLFNGMSIDDWTIHEGGQWLAQKGEIVGNGDRNYNYLIKGEVPLRSFRYELDMRIERGTAGLILGNNYHGEYPYYYLIDIARDAVMVRRSYTATRIEPVKQAFAEIAHGEWVHLDVVVLERQLSVLVNGREVLSCQSDRDSYSLFGLYLYHAAARFKNVRINREPQQAPGWARGAPPRVMPGGAGGAAASPRGPFGPLRAAAPTHQAPEP